jgi:signal transduction histidine kinase
MEAIGNLAGGIAHEFNNVLGIILGNAELAMDDVPDWNPAKESLERNPKSLFQGQRSGPADTQFRPQNHDGFKAFGNQHDCKRITQIDAGFHTRNG